MFKKLALALCISASAFGSTASVGFKLIDNNPNQNTVLGISIAQDIGFGFGYWTWLGMGTLDNEIKWAENTQALDFSFTKDVKFTLAAKLTEDIASEEFKDEYSLGVKIKLW
jgi:hypothetical protein